MEIILSKRTGDWHVYTPATPGVYDGRGPWGAGRTPDEAIGSLVRSHPEKFGVKILNGNPTTGQPTG